MEFRAGTHPRGSFTYYVADGVTAGTFATRVALFNPGMTPTSALWTPPCSLCGATDLARVLVRFVKNDGTAVTQYVAIPALQRRTIDVKSVAGLESAIFSIVVESDFPIVTERTVRWGDPFGAHAESAVAAPAMTWYVADGSTHSPFDVVYVIQNPRPAAENVAVPPTATVCDFGFFTIVIDGCAQILLASALSPALPSAV